MSELPVSVDGLGAKSRMRDRSSAFDRTDHPVENVVALAGRLAALLDLRSQDLVIGLGNPTAPACRALLDRVPLRSQIILVAPLDASSAQPAARGIRLADMSALEFARFPMRCDKILMDGALLGTDDTGDLLPLLFDRVEPNGRLVALLDPLRLLGPGARGRAASVAARLHQAGFAPLTHPPHRYDLVGGAKPALD